MPRGSASRGLICLGWLAKDTSKKSHVAYTGHLLSPSEHASLVEASYQVPKGIICLLSALRFHNLTIQSPRDVWIAIGHKAWGPKIPSLPVRFVRMSGPALRFGASEHYVSGRISK